MGNEPFWAEVITSHTTEEPTMRLRFRGGRLQQMVVVRRYDNEVPTAAAEEWRDVPEVPAD